MKVYCPVCEEKFQVAQKDKLRSYECPDCGTIFKLRGSSASIIFTLPKKDPLFNRALREAYKEFHDDKD